MYDASGRVQRLGDLVDEVSAAVGGDATVVWAPADFLLEREVAYWAGPRSLPLWLPEDARGMTSHDVSAAFDAGLTTRPIGETAADTLAWLRENPRRTPHRAQPRRGAGPARRLVRRTRLRQSGGRLPHENLHFPTDATHGKWRFHWRPSETAPARH